MRRGFVPCAGRMKMKTTLVLICGLLLVVVLGGCGGPASGPEDTEAGIPDVVSEAIEEAAAREGVGIDIESSDGSMSISGTDDDGNAFSMTQSEEGFKITTEDGEMAMNVGADAVLPEDFPKDVPLPKQHKLTGVMSMPEGLSVIATSELKPEEIAQFYAKETAAKGWKKEQDIKMGPMHMLNYTKDERTLSVTIAVEEGVTQLVVNIGGE